MLTRLSSGAVRASGWRLALQARAGVPAPHNPSTHEPIQPSDVSQKRAAGVVTSEKLAGVGNSATVYFVLVEVELSRPSSSSNRGLDPEVGLKVRPVKSDQLKDNKELRLGRLSVRYRIMAVFLHPTV